MRQFRFDEEKKDEETFKKIPLYLQKIIFENVWDGGVQSIIGEANLNFVKQSSHSTLVGKSVCIDFISMTV